MILHMVRKDLKLLKVLALVVVVLQFLLHWVMHRPLPFAADSRTQMLSGVITAALIVAMVLFIVQLVHQDVLAGTRQDWLTRPISRRDLLLSKLLSVALVIHLPIFVSGVLEGLISGFPLDALIGANLLSNLEVAVLFSLPVMAVAACARTLVEAILGSLILLISLLLLRYLLLPALGLHFDLEDTPIEWIVRVPSHLALLSTGAVVLLVAYFRRDMLTARALLIGGLAVFVLIHALPWNLAYSIQRHAAPSAIEGVGLTFASTSTAADILAKAPELKDKASKLEDPGTMLLIPLRLQGLPAGVVVHADRISVSLRDEKGHVLFRGEGYEPHQFRSESDQDFGQSITLSQDALARIGDRSVILDLTEDMTLFKSFDYAHFKALSGYEPVAGLGRCVSRLAGDGGFLDVACRQVRDLPPCLSFTIEIPGGPASQEQQVCGMSYTPGWLRFSTEAMDRVRGHVSLKVATDPEQLIASDQVSRGEILVRRYQAQAHLTQRLAMTSYRWKEWVISGKEGSAPR
jgi:ABC-type transport system involved in multi-copper enzyme maturation permease subunit